MTAREHHVIKTCLGGKSVGNGGRICIGSWQNDPTTENITVKRRDRDIGIGLPKGVLLGLVSLVMVRTLIGIGKVGDLIGLRGTCHGNGIVCGKAHAVIVNKPQFKIVVALVTRCGLQIVSALELQLQLDVDCGFWHLIGSSRGHCLCRTAIVGIIHGFTALVVVDGKLIVIGVLCVYKHAD